MFSVKDFGSFQKKKNTHVRLIKVIELEKAIKNS